METRQCGRSDLELSVLGAGCWAFGGGEYWGDQNQKDVDEVVNRSLDLGINYFDTAEVYNKGASEKSLGLALQSRRDEAVIGSKISPSNCYPDVLRKHCDASLRRLRTDRIDLYMVHWPIHPHSIRHFTEDEAVINNPPSVDDAFAALMDLRDGGKVRYVGVSNFGVIRLAEAQDLYPDIVVNELPYSLLTRAIELEIMPHCRETGVGIIGYMTLLQGLLADIYPTLDDVPKWQGRTRHFDCKRCDLTRHGEDGAEDETNRALADIRAICHECGLTMPEIAVKWAIANHAITCALVGARNVTELEANVKAVAEPLPNEVVVQLNKVTDAVTKKLGRSFDYYESAANNRTD